MKQILYDWMGNSTMSKVRREISHEATKHPSFNLINDNVWRRVWRIKMTHRIISDGINLTIHGVN